MTVSTLTSRATPRGPSSSTENVIAISLTVCLYTWVSRTRVQIEIEVLPSITEAAVSVVVTIAVLVRALAENAHAKRLAVFV